MVSSFSVVRDRGLVCESLGLFGVRNLTREIGFLITHFTGEETETETVV